jgi:hypothetical protein
MRRHQPAAWLHFEQLAGWRAELSRSAIHPSRWCHALHALPPPTHSSTAPIPARFQHLSKRVLEVTLTAACWIPDGVGGRFFLLPHQHVGFFHTHTHTHILGELLEVTSPFFFPPLLGLSSFKKTCSAYLSVFHLFFSLVWMDLRMHHRENTPLKPFEDPERAALQSGQWWGCHVPNTHGSSITFKCINTNAAGKSVLKLEAHLCTTDQEAFKGSPDTSTGTWNFKVLSRCP